MAGTVYFIIEFNFGRRATAHLDELRPHWMSPDLARALKLNARPFCDVRSMAWAVLFLAVPAAAATAQDGACTPSRPRVEALKIEGNKAISDIDLKGRLFTERAGRLRRWFGLNVGTTACLDTTEVRKDATRIERVYDAKGYPGTSAAYFFDKAGKRAATVRFRVRESRPVIVDSVMLLGIPRGIVDQRAMHITLRGEPLDTAFVRVLSDSVQDLLRAAGFARAAPPTFTPEIDTVARRASLTMTWRPGPLMHAGAITVDVTPNDPEHPAIPADDIRQLLRVDSGDVLRSTRIAESQQILFSNGVYRTVAIDTLGEESIGDTIPLRVRLIEGRHHVMRHGAGWGTLDCFRTTSRYTHQNFLRGAHRLQLDARLSKIGVGAPLDGFDALCAGGVRRDPFSKEINYHAGVSMQLRGLVGRKLHPELTLFSERRTEFESYVREVDFGVLASIDRPIIPRVSTIYTYRYDKGQTSSDLAVACEVFGLCRFNDQVLLTSPSTTHAVGVTFSRSAPMLGTVVVNDGRWAIETRLGTVDVVAAQRRVNFNRTQLEYAIYRPLSRLFVGAVRVQGGIVVTRRDLESLVPPQERFYSGGQNTVRGFGQNQLGPAVYIVREPQTSIVRDGETVREADPADGFNRLAPAGGTASALLNLELRTRAGWPSPALRYVAFIDAGRVWNNTGNYSVTALSVTPGLGVRLVTPIGPFRVDVGYNPHAYEPGPAFYLQRRDPENNIPGRAICVSPGTRESFATAPTSALGCPATFVPDKKRGLFPRLAFHFSIGEAF